METQRIFFALPLPRNLREHLASMRDRAVAQLGAEVLRPVKTENFHITLHFLGDQTPPAVKRARHVLKQLNGTLPPAPRISIGNPGAFPRTNAARVVWAGADDPGNHAGEINDVLGRALANEAFELDGRPFHPHITIAYVRKGAGRKGQKRVQEWLKASAATDAAAKDTEQSDSETSPLSRLVLYRSDMGPGGSTYTPLEEIELAVAER